MVVTGHPCVGLACRACAGCGVDPPPTRSTRPPQLKSALKNEDFNRELRGHQAAFKSGSGVNTEPGDSRTEPQITRLQRVRSASAQSQRKGAIAPCSWTPEESQVESCEHQDNADIHCQPFPESVSEEHEIYTDYDGCHRHHVKHDSYLSAHFSPPCTA